MIESIERTIDFDGAKIVARINPFTGGIVIEFDGNQIHHMAGRPTDAEICAAVAGYRAGVSIGKHMGRCILQNDIKNLLNLH